MNVETLMSRLSLF